MKKDNRNFITLGIVAALAFFSYRTFAGGSPKAVPIPTYDFEPLFGGDTMLSPSERLEPPPEGDFEIITMENNPWASIDISDPWFQKPLTDPTKPLSQGTTELTK